MNHIGCHVYGSIGRFVSVTFHVDSFVFILSCRLTALLLLMMLLLMLLLLLPHTIFDVLGNFLLRPLQPPMTHRAGLAVEVTQLQSESIFAVEFSLPQLTPEAILTLVANIFKRLPSAGASLEGVLHRVHVYAEGSPKFESFRCRAHFGEPCQFGGEVGL